MYEDEVYDDILDRVLGRVPEDIDTRESSFLYNATAPIAVELQNVYIALDNILNMSFFDTADREGKLQRCKERGIDTTQFDATKAICVLEPLPEGVNVPIGSEFNYDEMNFIVIKKVSDTAYHVKCETEGTEGNVTGEVIPVDYIEGLTGAKLTSIFQYGEDEASEERISDIYYESLKAQSFGGNRADYILKMKQIHGVGGVKVCSAAEWKGGGTVKLIFTTGKYTKPSDTFVNEIQTQVDPLQNQGAGYGIAPIGHIVTVAPVDETVVDITLNVTLQDGYTWDDVSAAVESVIDDYFLALNTEWDDVDNIIVRIAQIETRVLSVAGIIDVTGTTLNGAEQNLIVDGESIVVRGSVNATN